MKRDVSFWGVFSLATGAMISSGIFILPSLAFTKAGPAAAVSYFLAGVLALVGVLSIIELSTAMPMAGGDYYFINRSMGPMIGTISGMLGWVALSLKSAFAIFGISEILFQLSGLSPLASGAVLCLLFASLNIIGVKEAAKLQVLLVGGLLILMIIYVAAGLPNMDASRFTPFFSKGITGVLVTSGFIFISFGGLLKVANIAEEVKNPKRNIPLGMISSIGVVTILYTVTVLVTTGLLPAAEFEGSFTPVADAARYSLGDFGYVIITIAAALAFITTANAGIMAASRYPLALSRDGLLPSGISRLNDRLQTPVRSILITSVLIYGSLLFPLESLVKAASTVILTSYVLTNLSVIILRESRLSNYQPSFRTPWYPFLQLFGAGIFTFFIIDMGTESIEISLGFLFLCSCLYLFYGRRHNNAEFALLHVLKRITDSRLTEGLLENELREILIDRDNIEQDEFDELVKRAEVLDLDHPLSFEDLLTVVSEPVSRMTGLEVHEVHERFIRRQQESNTAITPFVAVPHIITGDDANMFLLLVRCRDGIYFTEEEPAVKAVFFFGGPLAKRDLHLKVLSSIAVTASGEGFNDMWVSASAADDLKNIFILSTRVRTPVFDRPRNS